MQLEPAPPDKKSGPITEPDFKTELTGFNYLPWKWELSKAR
ncbi:hypothetical protein NC99_46350 [Sunxiuqinia dokdonensis]|uniref:Uncharacterized protein n=1 Tax=Sunxiuqinia dokdonensis TaxID=1409788 RepID=A0A0L8V2U1_9BACT|nr:hypothetical protein NC99_46350 [Sunxiuqinia dokdonensis]